MSSASDMLGGSSAQLYLARIHSLVINTYAIFLLRGYIGDDIGFKAWALDKELLLLSVGGERALRLLTFRPSLMTKSY